MSNKILEELSQAMSKIDRPGTFCVSGSVQTVLPGLEVDGLGPIGLPLTGIQAKDLKKLCEQAPYGKGEKTLVDTSVRRVWRLMPSQFSLSNPDWMRFLKETLSKVQAELGLEKQKLESHLHELLLYEAGSFFLPHRDGEKLDRMVATLVIVLPSSYEGGELVVRHEGQEQTIDFSSVENSALQNPLRGLLCRLRARGSPSAQGIPPLPGLQFDAGKIQEVDHRSAQLGAHPEDHSSTP